MNKVMSRDDIQDRIDSKSYALNFIKGKINNMEVNQVLDFIQGLVDEKEDSEKEWLAALSKLDQAVELLGEAIGDRKAGYGCKLCHVISIDGIQAHDHGCVAPKIEAFIKEVKG